MHNYKELLIWKKAMSMVKMTYKLMNSMPDSERYGLTQQIRRAAVSVPSNIAEGAARSSDRDFIRFLYISNGSMAELLTQLELAIDLEFIVDSEARPTMDQILELQKMNFGLIKRITE